MKKVVRHKEYKEGWVFDRVSSVPQGNVQFGSPSQQRNFNKRTLQQVSEETGVEYRIIRTVSEQKSGRRAKYHLRTELEEAFYAVKNGKTDFLAFESVTRMGRWNRKNLELIETAADHNVEVFINGKVYNHRDKGDRVKFGIESLLAEEESNDTSYRVTRKQREAMVNNGKDTSTIPILSLDAHPTKVGMYTHNLDELKIVSDIFKTFCDLKSYALLKRYCADKGYRTKERWTLESSDEHGNRVPSKQMGGELFNEQRLRCLLTSPKLRGINSFRDDYDQFPKLQNGNKVVKWEYAHFREHGPLLDPTLIEEVDFVISSFDRHKPKSSKYGHVYLLTGILKDHNGNPFYGSNAKSGKHSYYYNRTSDKSLRKTLKKGEIEEIVCNRVKQYLHESGTLEKVMKAALNNRTVGLPLLEEEIPKVEKEISKVKKVIDRFTDTIRDAALNPEGDLAKILTDVVKEKEKAASDLNELSETLVLLNSKKEQVETNLRHRTLKEYLNAAMLKFDKKTDQQKKAIIQAIIPEVVVRSDNKVELKINPDPAGKAIRLSEVSACHNEHNVVLSRKWRE